MHLLRQKSSLCMSDTRNDIYLRFSDVYLWFSDVVIYDVVTFYVKNNMASVVWGLSAGIEWWKWHCTMNNSTEFKEEASECYKQYCDVN